MKNKLKLLLVIGSLFLQFSFLQAQEVTLHVETAGTLYTLIAESKKYEITNLTLSGELNGNDIRYIREMAGTDINGKITYKGKLAVLDLSDANIVEGGYPPYIGYSSFYTKDHTISESMFDKCVNLTKIVLPNSVTSIEVRAFQNCVNLRSITILNNVNSINNGAFSNCMSLESIIVNSENSNFSDIDGVLFNKDKTTLIKYPNAKGDQYAIPNSVRTIGEGAFSGCQRLGSVTIPNSVISIGDWAFSECESLSSITIPNSVTTIGQYAFSYCSSLSSITIPNSVISIGGRAFNGCTGLTEIYNHRSEPQSISNYVFEDVDKQKCKLYVPKGSYSSYWAATGWRDFQQIIEVDFSTNVESLISDYVRIQTVNQGGIHIDTDRSVAVTIYDTMGRELYNSILTESSTIPLNRGVYVLTLNGRESQKVMVK